MSSRYRVSFSGGLAVRVTRNRQVFDNCATVSLTIFMIFSSLHSCCQLFEGWLFMTNPRVASLTRRFTCVNYVLGTSSTHSMFTIAQFWRMCPKLLHLLCWFHLFQTMLRDFIKPLRGCGVGHEQFRLRYCQGHGVLHVKNFLFFVLHKPYLGVVVKFATELLSDGLVQNFGIGSLIKEECRLWL